MRARITELYQEYLGMTLDKSAAASLVLADLLASDVGGKSLTVNEAATRLSLCRKSVYDMCESGRIRHFKVGRAIRISLEEIERLESNCPRYKPNPLIRDHLS
jgi:excisionase family DNA binding protein